jgi:dipeptidase E
VDLFLGSISEIVFVPYALADHDAYVKNMNDRDLCTGRKLIGCHSLGDPIEAIRRAPAIFVGGGNSFRLLSEVQQRALKAVILERISAGVPYLGISAGSNLAGPTIKTTNDMPIVHPHSLDALGLVPFQINPHYVSGKAFFETAHGMLAYGGESRDDRLREFHEMNATPIIGLREGEILRVDRAMSADATYQLVGVEGARLFERGKAPVDVDAGTDLTAWVAQALA